MRTTREIEEENHTHAAIANSISLCYVSATSPEVTGSLKHNIGQHVYKDLNFIDTRKPGEIRPTPEVEKTKSQKFTSIQESILFLLMRF